MANNKYKDSFADIKQSVRQIQQTFVEQLAKTVVQYYNDIQKTNPNIFKPTEWKPSVADIKVEQLYNEFAFHIQHQLEDLLEAVYSEVSKDITAIYGEDDYPISKIEFYHKDGNSLIDRINKWYNPYNNKSLSTTFIQNKLSAVTKINQISQAEAFNEMEVVKFDKLFHKCKYLEITNFDEEADCSESVHCEVYWGIYSIKDDDIPPLPLYHPDCECFTVYYKESQE